MTALRVPNGTPPSQEKPMTLTILGCGTLGTAILSGILDSISHHPDSDIATPTTTESKSKSSTTTTSDQPQLPTFQTPTRFIACIRSPSSAKRITNAVSAYPTTTQHVTILQNENLKGVIAADIVILGCKPYMVKDLLSSPEIRAALSGKLLISICAGVPVDQISQALYSKNYDSLSSEESCKIVRVMPNTAALVRESMTVIATSNPPLPEHYASLTNWIFTRVGRTATLPPSLMDVSTALCGSGPAFAALFLESLADGAVAMGLPRADAQFMAAQMMKGTAGLVLNGEHPALVREKVCTPGGCTIGGVLELEEGGVRGVVSRSVRKATVVASQLGRGVSGVNGTAIYPGGGST